MSTETGKTNNVISVLNEINLWQISKIATCTYVLHTTQLQFYAGH